jgi:hypothetical protein
MKTVNLPEDLEGPNDKFFSHAMVQVYLATAGTKTVIDWKDVVDESIKDDKYLKLHTKLLEITDTVVKKGARGYFWLVCSTQVGDILGSIKGFVPTNRERYPSYTAPQDQRKHTRIKPLLPARARLR